MKHNLLTLQGILNHSVEKFADREVFTFLDEKAFTYSDVGRITSTLRNYLEKLNIKQGDKVAIFSSNSPNWSICYFAIVSMGAVVLPILPDFTPGEAKNILDHSETSAIFVSEGLYPKLEGIRNIPLIKIEDYTTYPGKGENVVYDPGEESRINYSVDPEDLAAIIYTSGTTGSSKGVMLLNRNIASNVHQGKDIHTVDEYDRFLSILPLSHTFENTLGMLVPFMSGAKITYLKKAPTAAILLPALQKVRPTTMFSVPLIIEKIYYSKIKPSLAGNRLMAAIYKFPPVRKLLHRVAGKKLYKTFGGSLKFFGIGGARLSHDVELFLLEGGFPYAIGYGLTETSPLLAGMVPKHKKYKLQSTGEAVKDVSIKISDPDPETGEGEVWVKGPNIMQGYYKEPELTSEVITGDGWFKTGDLGMLDKNNFLSIRGRSKNVIIGASGENIYPEEIESIINNFKHVSESLVIHKKGKLVALIHINREEVEQKYQHLKDDVSRKVEEVIDEILKEVHQHVNTRINKFSRIHRVELQPVPFKKTATLKIKRYLYN